MYVIKVKLAAGCLTQLQIKDIKRVRWHVPPDIQTKEA